MPEEPDPGDPGPGNEPPDNEPPDNKALLADLVKERKNRQAAERKSADLEKRLADIEASTKSDHEKALDAARKEAADAARGEEQSKAKARILRSEVKAAAAGRLADPDDAVRFLDLDQLSVNDDGEVDGKSLAAALDALLKDKPYLAADRRAGGPDHGPRGSGAPGSPSMNDLIRQAAGRR